MWMCQAEARVNHLVGSQTNLLKKMFTMWEDLLASPQIHPALQKYREILSSKRCLCLLDHMGLLVWCLFTDFFYDCIFKNRVFLCWSWLTLLAWELLVLVCGELWKWNYSVPLHWPFLYCFAKPISVLDKLSQKISLLSHTYSFITLFLENDHWVSTEAGLLVLSSPTLLEGNGERAFLSPLRIRSKLHHLVG